MSAADLSAIAARLTPRPFSAGEVLLRQGVWSGELSIIRTGIVQISLEADEGLTEPAPGQPDREVPLRRLVGGDCFGEMSLITGAPPSATARALTDGEAWTLGQQDFLQLALAYPELSRNINAILSERLLHTSRQQAAQAPVQVIVMVAEAAPLWLDLARALARIARRAVLFVDFTAAQSPADHASSTGRFTLDDLLNGRLRPGVATPDGLANGPATAALTVVSGGLPTAPGFDLSVALERLGEDYQFVLVALPPEHPALTAQLLAYATRALVCGRAAALPALRRAIAALPGSRDKTDLRVLLTDTPTALPSSVATRELLAEELGVPVQALLPADRAALPDRIAMLARQLARQRIGLAFGAGGAKGFAHLGVVRALRRLGIPVDYVAGSSIGAIVGAGVAMDVTTERIAAAFEAGPAFVFRPTLPLYGISSNAPLQAFFRRQEMYGDWRIENLPIPFAVSAADLTEGREIVMRKGPLWQAVLASAAIPGIYPPVRVGRHWLVDGGVVNPVPVSTAQLLGADVVIAVDLSTPLAPRQEPDFDSPAARRPPTLPNTILRARDIMMSEIRAHTAGEPSIKIKPRIAGVSIREFARGAQFIAAGEAAVEEVLPQLREQLPWLR